ncbi:MAG TPA: carboxypeptidase-like regulatory domain-containing protein, partial [Candidatus Acidoferrum sp.]|nr:carboxypeptidase-like regulatory domain-containing protein [Candidatus Acidoferrum sp.]
MKQKRLLHFGAITLAFLAGAASPANAKSPDAQLKTASKPGPGKLAGVVLDGSGTPQMGATVELLAEASGVNIARELLTNTEGVFRGEKLSPGL